VNGQLSRNPARLLVNRLLFQPPAARRKTPRAAGLEYRRLDIETSDGEALRGWWVKALTRRRGHFLFFHGNGEDITDCLPDAKLLAGIGFDVLLVDYRGYGFSTGRPSEGGTYRDAHAALEALLAQPRIKRDRVFYFGRSLGGAIALKLACDRPPAGLVLLSTFASFREVARGVIRPLRVPAAAIPGVYPSLARVRNLRTPLLIFHGDADELVPVSQGQKLYEAAPDPKKMHVFAGCDHNDVVQRAGEDLAKMVCAWYEELPPRRV
jgi:uncharacterized protein